MELLFGKEAQFIKWGESVSSIATPAKKLNNNNNTNAIVCKVDGRILLNMFNIDANPDI